MGRRHRSYGLGLRLAHARVSVILRFANARFGQADCLADELLSYCPVLCVTHYRDSVYCWSCQAQIANSTACRAQQAVLCQHWCHVRPTEAVVARGATVTEPAGVAAPEVAAGVQRRASAGLAPACCCAWTQREGMTSVVSGFVPLSQGHPAGGGIPCVQFVTCAAKVARRHLAAKHQQDSAACAACRRSCERHAQLRTCLPP